MQKIDSEKSEKQMPDFDLNAVFEFVARDPKTALIVGGVSVIAIGAVLAFLSVAVWAVFVIIGFVMIILGFITIVLEAR
jgi:ABC-type Co2+ transport system permease subunit